MDHRLCEGDSAAGYINGPAQPVTYNADGLATIHNCDFRNEAKFQEAYRLGMGTGHRFGENLHVEWRVFVCCWAAHHARHLAGDFVECGVNTGISSRAVMHYIDFHAMHDRRFFLLDTFNGIPVEDAAEEEREHCSNQNRVYFDCHEHVLKTFAPFGNAKIIRGRVPDTLIQIDSSEICYLSIDMNHVAPEIAAGNYLWPRLVRGGVLVLDDYGWCEHINQKYAWDAFAAERSLKILALPTGQGLLIKP